MLELIFTIFLIVILAVVVIGYLAPDKVHVERETVIDAEPETVFALVSDFRQWEKWSPWGKIDPETEYQYSGSGVGHRMDWKSNHRQVGNGSQEIIELSGPRKMVTALDFGEMGKARATFDIEPVDAGTAGPSSRVKWSLDTNMRAGVPVLRQPMATFFGFFMDRMMDQPYREGLANLKSAAEAERPAAAPLAAAPSAPQMTKTPPDASPEAGPEASNGSGADHQPPTA